MKHFVTYLRVSTQKQGASGLGLEAQRAMCDNFIKQNGGTFEREFIDVESGTHRDRKGLWDAIEYCKLNGCGLVIAKLDRLARDIEFTFRVINTGIDIHFVDMPVVNTMILGVFASVAQYERELVSTRTRQALQAKKARGEKMGAATEKYKATMQAKGEDVLTAMAQRRGDTKRRRFLGRKETQAFLKILANVFPLACAGGVTDVDYWDWQNINTKGESKGKILKLMRDYRDIDATLFKSWNFQDNEKTLQVKLATYIGTVRRSILSKSEE